MGNGCAMTNSTLPLGSTAWPCVMLLKLLVTRQSGIPAMGTSHNRWPFARVPSTPHSQARAAAAQAAGGHKGATAGGSGPLQPLPQQQQQPQQPPERHMGGRMPPGAAEAKKKAPAAPTAAAAPAAPVSNKRKGNWMDALKQQASAKRGSASAAARRGAEAAAAEAGGAGEAAAGVKGGAGRLQFPVLYRYNEGYTNAVKRPLLVRELL